MSNVKKQHYVPRFYLRHFCDSNEMIYAFDKPKLKSFKTNIMNIAQEQNFYDTNPHDIEALRVKIEENPTNFVEELKKEAIQKYGEERSRSFITEIENTPLEKTIAIALDPQFFETQILAHHESKWAQVLNAIIRELEIRRRIKKSQRENLAFIMAFQFFRTRQFREEAIELHGKVSRWLLDIFSQSEFIKSKLGISDFEPNSFQVQYNRDVEDRITSGVLSDDDAISSLVEIFDQHIWHIGINSTEQPFYTSDAPLVRRGHLGKEGLASNGIQIAYPLSSKYIIIMYDREHFSDRSYLDNKCIELNEDNVTYYNSHQVTQSRRQIYCSEDKFELANMMCEKHPELCNPNRPRFR